MLSNRKCFISWEWWREARQEEAVIRNIFFLTSPTSRPQSSCQRLQGTDPRRWDRDGAFPLPGTGEAAAAGALPVPGWAEGEEQTHEAPPTRGGVGHGTERSCPRWSHRGWGEPRRGWAVPQRPRDVEAAGEWGSVGGWRGPGLRPAQGFPPGFTSSRIWPRFLRRRWDAEVDVRDGEAGGWSQGSGGAWRAKLGLHQRRSGRIRPRSLLKS